MVLENYLHHYNQFRMEALILILSILVHQKEIFCKLKSAFNLATPERFAKSKVLSFSANNIFDHAYEDDLS